MSKTVKKSVVLVGFSGAGKTVVGSELGRAFAEQVVDTDAEVEKLSGRKIEEIIRVEGEERFRELEEQALSEALKKGSRFVVLGGGGLLRESNRKLLQDSAHLVWLDADISRITARVLAEERDLGVVRPILFPNGKGEEGLEDRVRSLYLNRAPQYSIAQLKVVTDFISPIDLAGVVAAEAELAFNRGDSKRVVIPLLPAKELTRVVVGAGVRESVGLRAKLEFPKASKCVLVSDAGLPRELVETITSSISGQGFLLTQIAVPAGELSKSLDRAGLIANEMLAAGVGREDFVVALGGGVVGDVAGFVASVYMRGVGLIQVPTTLVAQVDSAIGGKTAVNLEGGKNTLGSFYPARLVLSDPEVLSTLPDREWRAGLAEVVKYGLIMSAEFFCWLESNFESLIQRHPESVRYVVEFCARAKSAVVVEDLEDRTGKRATLNFGHTVGHALEKLSGYGSSPESLLHGEAVAVGMVVALRIGEKLKSAPSDLTERVVSLLRKLSLPVEVPARLKLEGGDTGSKELRARWREALRADKKGVADSVSYLLVTELG